MSFWAREIAGWLLVAAGLFAFYEAYDFLLRKRIFEAVPMVFVGFVVFRGGIHLLKVAVAAQTARLASKPVNSPARRPVAAARPIGPTPPKTILPGPKSAPPRDHA